MARSGQEGGVREIPSAPFDEAGAGDGPTRAPRQSSTLRIAPLDQRGQVLRAALGFAGLLRPSYDRSLWALRTWLDSWSGIGHVAVGMAARAMISSSPATTSAAGGRPSTRPGWSIRQRARRARGGSARGFPACADLR